MKKNRGITLIALIVTIIVLLILAGVSLNLIAGSEGILRKAEDATNAYQKAQVKEELDMLLMEIKMDLIIEKGRFTLEDLEIELGKHTEIGVKEVEVENERIKIDYKNYEFYVYGDLKSELIGESAIENINREIKISLEKNPIIGEDVKQNNYEFATINATIEPMDKITRVTINEREIAFDSTTGAISEEVTENGNYVIKVYGEDGKYNHVTVKVMDLTEDLDIRTVEELVAFEKSVNEDARTYKGRTVRLKNDLNLEGVDWKPIGYWNSEEDYMAFKGCFEGENHIIENMKINVYEGDRVSGAAFIGAMIGELKNLSFKNPYVYAEIEYGTAVAVGDTGLGDGSYALIENVKVLGGEVVTSSNFVAGICGALEAKGVIRNCYSESSILGEKGYVGGICGTNQGGMIENCYNLGDAKTDNVLLGGICGVNQGGTIKNCYNLGDIDGDYAIGGVCGMNMEKGIIEDCYNIGKVNSKGKDSSGHCQTGGITGANINTSTVKKCYNVGEVTGVYPYIGGIVGYNGNSGAGKQTVENVFNTGTIKKGTVIATSDMGKSSSYVGTLIGRYGTLTGNFGNVTPEEMKEWEDATILENLGENFKKDVNNKNNGLPILKWQ